MDLPIYQLIQKTVFMRFELKVALTQRLALKAKNGCLLSILNQQCKI